MSRKTDVLQDWKPTENDNRQIKYLDSILEAGFEENFEGPEGAPDDELWHQFLERSGALIRYDKIGEGEQDLTLGPKLERRPPCADNTRVMGTLREHGARNFGARSGGVLGFPSS